MARRSWLGRAFLVIAFMPHDAARDGMDDDPAPACARLGADVVRVDAGGADGDRPARLRDGVVAAG